jgi:hypothetical protein
MPFSRRDLLLSWGAARLSSPRKYHLSISCEAIDSDPAVLELARDAGVGTIWLASFLYGYWYSSPEEIRKMRERALRLGLSAEVINVPLGHPGDSLGAMNGNVPLGPPDRWKLAVGLDGQKTSGCSVHPPAVEENCQALSKLAASGVKRVFLDDDFRFARSPGMIGGCFCEEHLKEFFRRFPSDRKSLEEAVTKRRDGPLLRAWNAFSCDQLTAAFRRMQAASPIVLGPMVMYLGAEKAGIRLEDYRNVPFRVGETMFSDESFGTVKGKTDELFSVLFHRRFTTPGLAYSETTAFPANKLSAPNMAAKLAISTIADVRNTMFMSGLTAFPRTHWAALAPAMRAQAGLHRRVAGHRPHGLFQHYWGEASRHTGNDEPYSLFLASGVPFEVTDRPGDWAFLSDADAAAGGKGISRRSTPETLAALFDLKKSLRPKLRELPFIEDESPAVCAWYPTAHLALVWNLSEERRTFSLAWRGHRQSVHAGPLELVAVDLA